MNDNGQEVFSLNTSVLVKVLPLFNLKGSIDDNPFVFHVSNPAGEHLRKMIIDVANDSNIKWIPGRSGAKLTFI
jgi:hypothetical protein